MRRLLFALGVSGAQAEDAALRGLHFTPITERSPAPHLSLAPVAGVPGLWRAQGATQGHGLGHWRVRNGASTRLGLPPQTLSLRWGVVELPARCSLLARAPELAPGASADWACALDAPIPADLQGAVRWDLAPPLIVIEALLPPQASAPAPAVRQGLPRAVPAEKSIAESAAAAAPPGAKPGVGRVGDALLVALALLVLWVWRASRRPAARRPALPSPPEQGPKQGPKQRPKELREPTTPAPRPPPRLACPHCRAPFAQLQLPGHYGSALQLEHCDACRLLWFDEGELARLSPRGWTELLHQLAQHERSSTAPAQRTDARCPHCATRLQALHDQTLFGRFVGQACPQGHGRAKRDAALFAARGLFRRLHGFEVGKLKAQADCLACGAPREAGDGGDCRYCASPPMVIDLQRLAQSLGLQARGSTLGKGQALLWSCAGCGQALDAAAQSACPQCAHPVLAQRLAEVRPLLQAALERPPPTADEQVAARREQVDALIAHERMKADWDRGARPRSPAMRVLLGAVRWLGRRE